MAAEELLVSRKKRTSYPISILMTMINSLLTELHHKKCHSCQAEDLISDHSTGDIVCRSCGTVHGDRFVSDEAEWRDYEDRQGTDGSRSSMLVVAEDEMEHRSFSGGTKEDRDLLNRLQSSQYTKRELKMFDSFSNLEQLTFKLGLSDTLTERAKDVFKKAYLAKLGHRDAMVAGVVYYTCLIENSPRSMGEISALSGISVKKMSRIYQLLSKESSHSPTDLKKSSVGYVQLFPADLIGRMASQLKLSPNLISVARECCQRIAQYDLLNGCSPQMIAAGVLALIYVATKQKFKVTDLIKVSFSSEQGIKRIYHEMQQDCLSIFPREFVTSIGGVTQIPIHLPDTMS